MRILNTIAAAFSVFSAVPMPRLSWDARTTRYLLCAFPLVGALVGLCWILWEKFCGWLSLPALLRGAGWTLLPVILTGGIHLDGYADTTDALSSHAPPQRKREILRDPHSGAFAVIWLCAYFTGTLALCASLRSGVLMFPAFMLSRALSGAALMFLPLSDGSALARMFVKTADTSRARTILAAECVFATAWLTLWGGLTGIAMLGAALCVLARYAFAARREFDGVSGDLAGWFLQKAEFWMLAALTLAQYWEANT